MKLFVVLDLKSCWHFVLFIILENNDSLYLRKHTLLDATLGFSVRYTSNDRTTLLGILKIYSCHKTVCEFTARKPLSGLAVRFELCWSFLQFFSHCCQSSSGDVNQTWIKKMMQFCELTVNLALYERSILGQELLMMMTFLVS